MMPFRAHCASSTPTISEKGVSTSPAPGPHSFSSSHSTTRFRLAHTRKAMQNAAVASSAAKLYWNSTVVWCAPSAGRYG